jgi:hypothetical protein
MSKNNDLRPDGGNQKIDMLNKKFNLNIKPLNNREDFLEADNFSAPIFIPNNEKI